jgi:ribosome-associated translation inhibitor RaiA
VGDGTPDVAVVGAPDAVTASYVREKLRQVARATGRPIGRAVVSIAVLDDGGDVLVDVTIEIAHRSLRSRVVAGSAMSALDRFESQLRRRLAADAEARDAVALASGA